MKQYTITVTDEEHSNLVKLKNKIETACGHKITKETTMAKVCFVRGLEISLEAWTKTTKGALDP
jgi:hypothetical protein